MRSPSCEGLLLDEAGGPVLGILPDAQYPNASIMFGPGDILTFYTDGVNEQADDLTLVVLKVL